MTITDDGALRDLYGTPSETAVNKQMSRLDGHCRSFIARSPFCVLGTSDANGRCDTSPKGDAPGFVQVLDDHTLLLPDRLGNNRLDSWQNVLANPQVAVIFFVPGVNETLRVNGKALLTTDEALLAPLAVRSRAPQSGLLVTVEEAFLHCAKALIRSDLWNPEKQIERKTLPSMGKMLSDQIEGLTTEEADQRTEKSLRERLY